MKLTTNKSNSMGQTPVANTDLPILIVGQGISGSILGLKALKRSIPFKIIDDGHKSAASLAAAGLYNPLILKRLKTTWNAQQFIPVAREFYREIKETHEIDVERPVGICRRIHDIAEYNDWSSKEDDPLIGPFLGRHDRTENVSEGLKAAHGYRHVKQAGYVDIDCFLKQTRSLFESHDAYSQERFSESKLDRGAALHYDGQAYSKILFCVGYKHGQLDSFFPDLPFNPAKGHTLVLRCPGLSLKHIVNGPCFILPLGDDLFRVGSTYSWHQLDEKVEEPELEKLMERFRSICPLDYEIIASRAGVRPTTKDRRPLIGASPVDERIHFFGGMGSRAIMTGPLLADMYWDYSSGQGEIWPEVNLMRSYT